MIPLVGLIVFLGVYPKPMLDRIQPSVDKLITHIEDQVPSFSEPSQASGGS
jgi:NADH-quinone oxidoreductase subunit M